MLEERPGFFARNDAWWDRAVADDPEHRDGASPLRCVIAEDHAGPRGYALFSGRERWDQAHFLPDAAIEVREVITADPAATAAIWADLLSRDLTTEFHIGLRPVDDPLLHLLADPRRAAGPDHRWPLGPAGGRRPRAEHSVATRARSMWSSR